MSARLLSLRGPLPVWDIERRHVFIAPVARWVEEMLREWGLVDGPLADLSALHEQMSGEEALEASRRLTRASLQPLPRRLLHDLIREILPETLRREIWAQSHAHFRILVPHDERSPVPVHTDYGFGHSLLERNLWFALTDAEGPGALHLCSFAESLSLIGRLGTASGVLEGAEPVPVPVRAGDVLLFTPLHIHGARPPEGRTRVSFDVRIRPRGPLLEDPTFTPLHDPHRRLR